MQKASRSSRECQDSIPRQIEIQQDLLIKARKILTDERRSIGGRCLRSIAVYLKKWNMEPTFEQKGTREKAKRKPCSKVWFIGKILGENKIEHCLQNDHIHQT